MVNRIESTRPNSLLSKSNKLQQRLIVNTVSETQQKQTKGILPAQLTEQANFTLIAECATDNQRLDKRTMQLFTVNSNVHLKRLIAIKVLLQCRLASCNCSINSPKETYNKTGVCSTAQISGLFSQQKHSDWVNRIWLHGSRNVTEVLVNLSCTFIMLSTAKQQNNFFLSQLFETMKQTQVVVTSC